MNIKSHILTAIIAVFVLIGAVLFFGAWGTVNAGHRGVVLRMSAVTGDIKNEGFYLKLPLLERVVSMDVRQQKEQVTTEAASRDLQIVHATIALNLTLSPARAATVYQSIGVDYLPKIVAPSMQEAIKAVIAQYTAEELISRREDVRNAISVLMKSKLEPFGIETAALNIVNLEFSQAFNSAIEAKVTAEQNALAARNKLAQTKYEAEQAVATAKGKAESMQIESEALMRNPQVLQLRALEKWDGVLPRFTGNGVVPFIQIPDSKQP